MKHSTSLSQLPKLLLTGALICCLCGCSGVWPLGAIVTDDGTKYTFIHAKSRNFLGMGGTLTGLYVLRDDPITHASTLVRADANGSTSSALENLKGFVIPVVP
jgi:hypothetical protein